MTHIVLASSSPRRKELLSQANIPFTVHAANTDETIAPGTHPAKAVEELAVRKAEAVWAKYPDKVVIGADTVVVLEDRILGKPETEQEAMEMLSLLSGRTHAVYTGVAIVSPKEKAVFHAKTNVDFWELTKAEITAYIKTGDPFDKAGSYGIQTAGALFVQAIHGDYFNVVGLPISLLYQRLRQMGFLEDCVRPAE